LRNDVVRIVTRFEVITHLRSFGIERDTVFGGTASPVAR